REDRDQDQDEDQHRSPAVRRRSHHEPAPAGVAPLLEAPLEPEAPLAPEVEELPPDDESDELGTGGNATIIRYHRRPSDPRFASVFVWMPTSTWTQAGAPDCVRSQVSLQKRPS